MSYPHIVEFNKTFIVPLAGGDRLDITKLLEFATNLVVIDGLTGSGVSQRYYQSALESLVGVRCKAGRRRVTPPDFGHDPVLYGRLEGESNVRQSGKSSTHDERCSNS